MIAYGKTKIEKNIWIMYECILRNTVEIGYIVMKETERCVLL
jgi:hypothetical protein